MIRIQLDDPTRDGLQALRRQDLPAKVRDRLEMVLLADAGWSAPRIAGHLGCHPHTARAVLKDFRARGRDALFPGAPGPAPDLHRRQEVTERLRRLLEQDRTWTSQQLSEALRPDGIALGGRQVRRYLAHLRAGYLRTASTTRHKQDPAKVERARGVLGGLKKKRGRAG